MTLTQLFTNIANAIRSKKGTSALIQAEDFASEISSISTGIDTSDATATDINIKDGETAYARGSKITGTLPVLTYPINPYNPSDYNYQFIASTSTSSVTRDGDDYLLGTYQIASQSQPDSWMFEGNRKMKMGIPYSAIVSRGGITANKIKLGETIYGVTGTYSADGVPDPKLSYIKSTGTQYINTGITLNNSNFIIDVTFTHNATSSYEQPIVSIWNSSTNYWNLFITTNNQLDFYYRGHNYIGSVSTGKTYRVTLEVQDTNIYILATNVGILKITGANNSNSTTFKLFARGDGQCNTNVSISSLTLSKNGTKTLELVPVKRTSDNVVCMYDKVSTNYYTNAGTGNFVAGSII